MVNPVLPAQPTSTCRAAVLTLCLFVFVCCGCQTINVRAPFPWDREKPEKSPDKIMAVWTDAVKTEPGKASERGFGGRVLFYDEKGKTMKVKGEVSIYLFDDDRSLDEAQVPEKKFVFPADTLELRYSKCSLGHSYNFWVPVGPVKGPNRKLSLVTKIELEQGGSVVSGVARKILPGSGYSPPPPKVDSGTIADAKVNKRNPDSSSSEGTDSAVSSQVAQASYTEPITAHSNERNIESRTISAETIQLTPSFTERLRKATKENRESPPASKADLTPSAPASEAATTPTSPQSPPSPDSLTNSGSLPNSPAARSEPTTPQAQSLPSVQPNATHPRYQPHPAGWLSSLPSTPRSGFQSARPKIERSALQRSRQAVATLQAQAESQALASGNVVYSDGVAAQDD
jgi:hypothetical protein